MASQINMRPGLLAAVLWAALLLAGCTISSGLQHTNSQAASGAGNLTVSFVSSDSLGRASSASLPAASGATLLEVICIVQLEEGALRLELLEPDGSVVLTLDGRTGQEQVAAAQVHTDAEGRLHYRLLATEARGGSYRIIYQPAAPTPTPAPGQ